MTISSFKRDMIAKAKKKGYLWECFGQTELRKLKDKYKYNPYGDEKERKIADEIDKLDYWACRVSDKDIR